jgi:transposase
VTSPINANSLLVLAYLGRQPKTENRKPKTQAKFECVECGFAEKADLTAAINILRAGHARLACQVNGAIMLSVTGTHRSDRPHPEVEAVESLAL